MAERTICIEIVLLPLHPHIDIPVICNTATLGVAVEQFGEDNRRWTTTHGI